MCACVAILAQLIKVTGQKDNHMTTVTVSQVFQVTIALAPLSEAVKEICCGEHFRKPTAKEQIKDEHRFNVISASIRS